MQHLQSFQLLIRCTSRELNLLKFPQQQSLPSLICPSPVIDVLPTLHRLVIDSQETAPPYNLVAVDGIVEDTTGEGEVAEVFIAEIDRYEFKEL